MLMSTAFSEERFDLDAWLKDYGFWANQDGRWAASAVCRGVGQACERNSSSSQIVFPVVVWGENGNGKKTLLNNACVSFGRLCPQGTYAYNVAPKEEWEKCGCYPCEWHTADLLALCDCVDQDVPEPWQSDLFSLVAERQQNNMVTLLSAHYDFRIPEDDGGSPMWSDLRFELTSPGDMEERMSVVEWTNNRFDLGLNKSAVKHLVEKVSGSSGSIIEQIKRVVKFAAENAAVPLTDNVIDYALKQAKA